MGAAGYDKFFKPLLIGKFGEEYDRVNMAWMWARVKTRSVRLGIFEGGFQAFLDTLAEAIKAQGATIRLNTPVERIGYDGGSATLQVGGETLSFDRILATTSPKLLLKLAPQLGNTHYGDMVADLRSIGGLCVVVALKQQLLTDGTYWLSLPATSPDKKKNRFPFLALVEHTNWMDKAHYGGDHLIYCGDYAPANHEYFRMNEDESGRALRGNAADLQPRLQAGMDSQNLGFPRALRPADPLSQPEPAHPGAGNAAPRRLLGEHESGLSV